MSGETYSTVNMACVFRSELQSSLEEDGKDLPEIAELKDNMRRNFDNRFPMSELICVGALLDPRCQNLVDVMEFLSENGTTAFDLIKKWTKDIRMEKSFPQTKEKDLNLVEELVEKHSSLRYVRQTLMSENDVDREIFFCYHSLVKLRSKV